MEETPASRAARLLEEARAAREALQNQKNDSTPRAKKPRAGAAARDLNKRIRGVLKEQISEVYSATSQAEAPDAEYSKSAIESAPSSGSWESVANEIAPMTAPPVRGLATGAMRRIKPSSQIMRAVPTSPHAILCEHHAPETALHAALSGEERSNERGAHYLLSRAAGFYDLAFEKLGERLARVLSDGKANQFPDSKPSDFLFVDIETTGISSALPLFLVGALGFDDETFAPRLQLFLARDYPEEAPLLHDFHALAAGKNLVTFNGKSFDWPYIEGRSVAHRLRFSAPPQHFDLLHAARRKWRGDLPNCRLQTLELYLCNRTRIDDVAGADIPATYHEFVALHAKTGGGAHLLAPILHHNALDLLTTAELFCLHAEEGAGSEAPGTG